MYERIQCLDTVDNRWLECEGDMLETNGLKPRPKCDYFQENKNSMAEFPGTAVGFLLLKME